MKTMIITKSSNISKVEFENDVLYVTFLNGSRYSYSGVALNVYEEMVNAESVGKYFCKNVKGSYAFQRV